MKTTFTRKELLERQKARFEEAYRKDPTDLDAKEIAEDLHMELNIIERQEGLDRMQREDPQRYQFFMGAPAYRYESGTPYQTAQSEQGSTQNSSTPVDSISQDQVLADQLRQQNREEFLQFCRDNSLQVSTTENGRLIAQPQSSGSTSAQKKDQS